MNPVSITDTTDWVCKCGHKHHEHMLINGDETCMHGMLDDIHDDVCCDCVNFSSQENKQ